MRKILFIFSFLFLATHAFSFGKGKLDQEFLLKKVLSQLGLKEKDINEELYVEKVLPYSKSQTVMVIPKYRKNEKDESGNSYFELDAYVIIADNTTGKILYKYYEENAWTSDAVVLSNIIIDTGLYNLTAETRAFGIRVSYTGSSRPNPYSQTDLSLFVVETKSLKRILKNYTISDAHGEWDMNCAGEFEDTESVIDIDANKTNGLNNLIVKETIVYTKNIPVKEDCIEKKTIKHNIKKLKYNGVEYK
ncbi:hypothetical protein ACFOG5_15765 [Pedobacter fastidiosus]|uniref:DUF4468 domain-containing protein n=1 Tax=Pedobacter fastidiosus TaxID=2765361 RepID=A0ABR7KQ77_9SPHI|nr:hypothetical protein [Pedobacter fastidiosus]MBC6110222.1 hypothetical protein [Pedobacter fastidiosus]